MLNIPTISLSKLEQNEDAELSRLYDASRKYGFFRLVLQDSENGRALLQHAEGMLDISADMFSLEKDVLNKFAYNPPKDLLGYVFILSLSLVYTPWSDRQAKAS